MEWRKQCVSLDVRGRYVCHSVAKVMFAVWGEKRWSHREFVVLVVSGRSVNVSRKCCPEVKWLGVGVEYCITVDIANFGGDIKLFLCVAYWIHIQLGTLGLREIDARVPWIRQLPSCCCCCYWRADSKASALNKIVQPRRVFEGFANLCCPERWFGLNRISHPDWVKLCVDPNGRIKLRAKQKCEILSATI